MAAKKSVATLLVEIAQELYELGSIAEGRQRPGDPEPVVYTYAAPKNAPDARRPLHEIRDDLAAVYMTDHGSAPSKTALGDAMTVLEGIAKKASPTEADSQTLGSFLAAMGGNLATELVKLAQKEFTFGVTTTGEVYAVPKAGPNVARPLRGGRRSLRSELAQRYYETTRSAANSQALADALLVLEGEAQGMEPAEVALRVGRDPIDGRLVLDLGADDGRAVVIGAYGWEIVETSPVLFWRTNATLPLPEPDDLGSLEDLRQLLNVTEADWPLIVAWLVAALIPEMPHPVLLLRGEHGTAKSSAARLLTSLLDRCASQLRTAPRNVEDWAVACAGSWLTCLDNVSDLQHWLQDAICRAVTGDGMLRRQLYTDSDVSVLAFKRVIAMTSVDPGRLNGDLADRLLTVELDRLPEAQRTSENDLGAKWAELHPGVLGGLLHTAVNVLKALGPVRHHDLPRMADYARVLLAVDEVLGTSGYATYTEQASRTAENVAEGDSVVIAIRENITEPWTGTASELLKQLSPEKPPKDWPSTPQGMGGRLVRAAPTLRALGWTVEYQRVGNKRTRQWTLTPPDSEEYPAGSSATSGKSAGPSDQGERADDQADDTLFADDQADDDNPDVSAGQTVADEADMSAGYSSEQVRCELCGDPLPLLRVQAGMTTCTDCYKQHDSD